MEARREPRLLPGERQAPPSRGEAGAGGGEPVLGREGGGAEEGAHPPMGLGRAATQDVRPGRVGLREVWRQAPGAGVLDGSGWGARYLGTLGTLPAACEASRGCTQRGDEAEAQGDEVVGLPARARHLHQRSARHELQGQEQFDRRQSTSYLPGSAQPARAAACFHSPVGGEPLSPDRGTRKPRPWRLCKNPYGLPASANLRRGSGGESCENLRTGSEAAWRGGGEGSIRRRVPASRAGGAHGRPLPRGSGAPRREWVQAAGRFSTGGRSMHGSLSSRWRAGGLLKDKGEADGAVPERGAAGA